MNSSLIAISTLIKSNIGEKCLVSFLTNVSTPVLRDYLKLAKIYKGEASKKKTDLIEMIVYGCITNKLKKEGIQDISTREANEILKTNKIILKLLPGYGNDELKKKDMKPVTNEKASTNEKSSIKVFDWYQWVINNNNITN